MTIRKNNAAPIDFQQIETIAKSLAQYAGTYHGAEVLLGYQLKAVTPVRAEHAHSVPLEGLVKVVFEHWFLVSDRLKYGTKDAYEDPENLSYRLMSYEISAENLIDYEKARIEDQAWRSEPLGSFELLAWHDTAVSKGNVPDRVVAALCDHLDGDSEELLETYDERFWNGELPEWDPRVLQIIKEAWDQAKRADQEYEDFLEAEPPQQKTQRESHFKMNSMMATSCSITREFYDTIDSIKFYMNLRDQTKDPAKRQAFQVKIDYLLDGDLVTEEDIT